MIDPRRLYRANAKVRDIQQERVTLRARAWDLEDSISIFLRSRLAYLDWVYLHIRVTIPNDDIIVELYEENVGSFSDAVNVGELYRELSDAFACVATACPCVVIVEEKDIEGPDEGYDLDVPNYHGAARGYYFRCKGAAFNLFGDP